MPHIAVEIVLASFRGHPPHSKFFTGLSVWDQSSCTPRVFGNTGYDAQFMFLLMMFTGFHTFKAILPPLSIPLFEGTDNQPVSRQFGDL
jgi:hypothetical protein